MNTNTALYQVSTIYAYFSNKSHHFVYLIIMIGLLGVMHYTIKKQKSQLRQMSDFCYYELGKMSFRSRSGCKATP